MAEPPEPTRRTDPIWLEPYPDAPAITWFFDRGLFPHFGLPRTLPE